MTTNASRAQVDFDAFERDLRQPTRPAAPKADPLAELARIVGQDDPFRALLEARDAKNASPEATKDHLTKDRPARIEPTFRDEPAGNAEESPADAFDQYLASVEQGLYSEDRAAQQAAAEEPEEGYRAGPVERPRKRGRLAQVGAGLGVLALCVSGALAWRGMHGSSSDGPVTVLADQTPLKVQPTAADGVEIPDQNKQIYDRKAKDGQIKIVNREEQPLDVAQAARVAAASDAGTAAAPGQGGTTPAQAGLLTDSLGEPRRVRTVSVKPDTPVHTPPAQQAAEAPASAIPTMTLPGGDTAAPAPRLAARTASPAQPGPAPQTTASETPAQPAPAEAAPQPARKPAQRVASVAPETTASTSEPAVAPDSAASNAPVGGFSVQLGVRASEADARAALRQMQSKYSQLSGKPELIRQAEVNGKTIFRVRVGPLAKNEATSLCSTLQGAGGQCFVAKN